MPPLRVEYAKSARSRCTLKECSKFIEKGEVRLGTAVMMPGMDEPSFKWRHLCCFTARQVKNAGGSVDNIEGFDDLMQPDRDLVVKMMKGSLVGDSSIIGKTGTAGASPSVDASAPKKKAEGGKAKTVVPKKRQRAAGDGADSDATDDYEVFEEGQTTSVVERPMCPYGASCFRKNAEHRAQFRHDAGESSTSPLTATHVSIGAKKKEPATALSSAAEAAPPAAAIESSAAESTAGSKVCPHGPLCFRTDAKHFADFVH